MGTKLTPTSEGPLRVTSGLEAFSGTMESGRYRGSAKVLNQLLFANEDPQRIAYEKKKYNEARANGLNAIQAKLKAKQAANSYRWLLSPFCNRALAQNSLLPLDSWRLLTEEVQTVAQRERNFVGDFISRGMVYPVPDLGVFYVQWQRLSDLSPAQVSMRIRSNTEYDDMDFDTDSSPLPVIYKDHRFDMRDILAARRDGFELDMTAIGQATQKVLQKEEELLVDGDTSISYNNSVLYGLLNKTGILTESGASWGTVANIEANVREMILTLRSNNYRGPYGLYIHENQYSESKQQNSAASDNSAMAFVMSQHPELSFIKPTTVLDDGTAVMMQMTKDVADVAIASDVQVIQWDDPDGAGVNVRVMSAMTPRPKVDRGPVNGSAQSGILKYTGI